VTAASTTSDAPAPHRRNPAATRRALLDATLSLLAERGESGIRVTEVARRAGTTTGAIYSHFRDRAELLAAAGVTIELHNADTLVHGYLGYTGVVPAATEATQRGLAALRAALHA